MQNIHGKEIDLLRTTVKVPGKRLPRATPATAPGTSPRANGLALERSATQLGTGTGEERQWQRGRVQGPCRKVTVQGGESHMAEQQHEQGVLVPPHGGFNTSLRVCNTPPPLYQCCRFEVGSNLVRVWSLLPDKGPGGFCCLAAHRKKPV